VVTFRRCGTLASYGFRADKIDAVRYKEFVVSARACAASWRKPHGRSRRAGSVTSSSSTGARARANRGKALGFPTANLETANELLPPNGVYATMTTIDGIVHPSITNVGVRPTFGDTTKTMIEAYVLGYEGDLYGRVVRLGFVQRLRDERKFDDVDALRAQIEAESAQGGAIVRAIVRVGRVLSDPADEQR